MEQLFKRIQLFTLILGVSSGILISVPAWATWTLKGSSRVVDPQISNSIRFGTIKVDSDDNIYALGFNGNPAKYYKIAPGGSASSYVNWASSDTATLIASGSNASSQFSGLAIDSSDRIYIPTGLDNARFTVTNGGL